MKNLKRRKKLRLANWDYSSVGYYFITICAYGRENIFGSIASVAAGADLVSAPAMETSAPVMELSDLGKIIKSNWEKIPELFKNIELDEYIIMPNHIHGILIVTVGADTRSAPTEIGTVSRVIQSFKSRCAVDFIRLNRENGTWFSYKIWQRSFHDHIIRDKQSLSNIRYYIINNPAKWLRDKERNEGIA